MAALIGGAMWLAGCGTSPEDLCDSICDCRGCSDREFDDCVRSYEAGAELAERYGCEDDYDDYLDCVDDSLECHYSGVSWDYRYCNDLVDHCWPQEAQSG
jgi:hypothetical protein